MMIEVAIGVSSFLGGILIGWLFKKERVVEKVVEVPGEPLPATPYLKFYALADYVEARAMVEEADAGASVFINLEKLNVDPLKRRQFLDNLKEESNYHDVVLRSINQDLILVVPKKARIEVKTVSRNNYPGRDVSNNNETFSQKLNVDTDLLIENL